MDLDLIEMLLMFICGEGAFRSGDTAAAPGSAMGAVLVFLPGWDEIIRLKDKLEQSPLFGGSRSAGRAPGARGGRRGGGQGRAACCVLLSA